MVVSANRGNFNTLWVNYCFGARLGAGAFHLHYFLNVSQVVLEFSTSWSKPTGLRFDFRDRG